MDRIVEILTKHGWPPAALLVAILLSIGLYTLYGDHKEMQTKWQELAKANLEANLLATSQRRSLQEMLDKGITTQSEHLRMIKEMDQARLKQNQLDQQLTAAAVQALRQIADKQDVQMQIVRPEDVLHQ